MSAWLGLTGLFLLAQSFIAGALLFVAPDISGLDAMAAGGLLVGAVVWLRIAFDT